MVAEKRLTPLMSQTTTPEPLTVHDLQALAAEAAASPVSFGPRTPSRAARLHLIDLLSRWGGSGLAILAAVAVFVSVVIARDEPLRSSIWALMVFGALYLCRRYRKEFRRGDRIASRPFRWRAYYTSTIAVASAAFGAGAFILALPAPSVIRLDIIALLTTGALASGSFHSAHRMTAMAAALPAALFISAAVLGSAAGAPVQAFVIAILTAGLAGLWVASSRIASSVDRKFPRTGLVRREMAPSSAAASPSASVQFKSAAKA